MRWLARLAREQWREGLASDPGCIRHWRRGNVVATTQSRGIFSLFQTCGILLLWHASRYFSHTSCIANLNLLLDWSEAKSTAKSKVNRILFFDSIRAHQIFFPDAHKTQHVWCYQQATRTRRSPSNTRHNTKHSSVRVGARNSYKLF